MRDLAVSLALTLSLAVLAGCSSTDSTRNALPSPSQPSSVPADDPSTLVPPVSAGSTAPTGPTGSTAPTGRPSATGPSAPPQTSRPPAPPGPGPQDPLASSPPLATAPPPGQPPCSPVTLTVTDADAVYTPTAVQELFTVRTTGPNCQLQGYPSVQLLDAAGAPLAATVGRGGYGLPEPAGSPVTLSRDTSLSFFVATSRDGTCVDAATVVVTLPGTSTPLRAPTRLQACAGAVGVGPVQRLAGDE